MTFKDIMFVLQVIAGIFIIRAVAKRTAKNTGCSGNCSDCSKTGCSDKKEA